MKNIIQPLKGTRDFYPEEMLVRGWLYSKLRNVSEAFGYQEYDGPFLEKIDLYAAKSGEELVKEQAFVFEDRGGDLITLRPELTPSLARMVAQKQNELAFPLRWWSFGPFWRYERPQKGRTREFFQWNIDLIGVNSPEADAELVDICASFFKAVGLSPAQVQIRANDRHLMDSALNQAGITGDLKALAFKLIDRRDKLPAGDWEQFALESGLNQAQLDGLKNILADGDLWKQSETMQRFFKALDVLGVRDYVVYDPHIIRGLLYYTGIVFEAVDQDGGRSILGGGHYDNLIGDVGGDPLPGVGFAMGDVMTTLVMRKYGVIPVLKPTVAQVLVTVFEENRLLDAYSLAGELRQHGVAVVCYPEAAKLPKQLKFADRMSLRFAVIVGPDEAARGEVVLKDLVNRSQVSFTRGEAAQKIAEMLAQARGL